MSYSQKRILRALLTIVAVLALLLAVVTALKRRGEEEQEPDASTPASSEEGLVAQAAEYGTLIYSNGTATLSFATDAEGKWYWADDPSFPLAQTYVARIIDTISSLKPQQTITDGDALEDYGLSQPAMTITATSGTVDEDPNSSGGGARTETEAVKLYIGNQVSGGSGSYYLYIDGAPETIYVVADTLVTQISRGIYDMMELPELEELEESSLRSITVQGPSAPAAEEGGDPVPGLTTVLTASAGGDAVTWRSGGEDVTGTDRARKLVSLARTVTLEKCVDFKPSDDAAALCGFDNPAATAVARYQVPGEEELQTRTIVVGNTAMDGASRYVRVDDDTTIYAVSADTLAPLLQTAESGLAE